MASSTIAGVTRVAGTTLGGYTAGMQQEATTLGGYTAGGYTIGSSTIGAPRVITAGSTYPTTIAGATTISSSPTYAKAGVTYAKPVTTTVGSAQVFAQAARPAVMMQAAPVMVASPTAERRALDESRVRRAPAVYKTDMAVYAGADPTMVYTGGDATMVVVDDEPSIFGGVPQAPPDAILSLAGLFKEDKFPQKVNLGIGAYRDENGKPWPLPSVMQAQMMVAQDPNEDKEYVPIDGKPEHKKPVQQLIFSDAEIASGNLATTQALSGTGSLAVIGQFLSSFMGCKTIHLPDPTWGNHNAIFKRAGLEAKKYTYYKPETRGFDFEGCMASLSQIPAGDAVLLHAVAQNPTGVDPTPEQWNEIVAMVAQLGVIPVLDNAYQGYASGSLEEDGFAQTLFEESGLEYFVAQSFAKNFGLYGERIGYIHVRCASPDISKAVLSQLKILIRQAYSSPPRHGAAIVYQVLSNPELKAQWLEELLFMAQRITVMRNALRSQLENLGTPGTWNHITDQIGMFSYTGLDTAQVERMVKEFHVYMTKDGRISVAGLNTNNVNYVAESIDRVVRGS